MNWIKKKLYSITYDTFPKLNFDDALKQMVMLTVKSTQWDLTW